MNGELLRCRGLTRDVSWKGVYSYVEQPLAVGLEVEADIIFPVELTDADPLLFRCRCQVVRSERFHSRYGVAVSLQNHHLIEAAKFYRRASLRVVPPPVVIAKYGGMDASIRDLSQLGAFIIDHQPLPLTHKFELRLQVEEWWKGDIVIEALVRRVEPQVGMGVEFVAVSEDNNRRLRDLVAKCAKSQQ
jgi:hypothetical protein